MSTLRDVTAFYRSEGRPAPITKRAARNAASQYFTARPADDDAWTGFIVTPIRGAGRQIVRVQIGRRWPHRMVKLGYVGSPRSAELIPGMRLVDPAGHQALVLSGYPDVELQWRHYARPTVYRGESATDSWISAA